MKRFFALALVLAMSATAIADDKGSGKGPGGPSGGPPASIGAPAQAHGGPSSIGAPAQAPNVGRPVPAPSGPAGGGAVTAPRNMVVPNQAHVQAHVDAGPSHVDVGQAHVGVDTERSKVTVRTNERGHVVFDDHASLGHHGFDEHGIGRLDEREFRDRHDNNWRYAHWHNQVWYWLPTGSWTYWNGTTWIPYNAATYVDSYVVQPYAVQPQLAVAGAGPYYEDQGGFYTMQGGQKVYDPSIQRVSVGSGVPAPTPGPY